MGDPGYDFEFERRFWVSQLPAELAAEPDPSLIVQGYFLAADGYALRLRCQAEATFLEPDFAGEARSVVDRFADRFTFCTLTAKGPWAGGTRYEVEREVDPAIGVQMLRRGGALVIKNRFSLWHHSDGWVIDVFCGDNAPLIIAEVERGGPVTDLVIPDFCVSEISDDARFANDALAAAPYASWENDYRRELAKNGPRFLAEFGVNEFDV